MITRNKKIKLINSVNKIASWYRNIKTKLVIAKYFKYKNEIDIELKDYYLKNENCWDF